MPGYWSGQPVPSPGDLPHPGIESGSPALQADSLPTELLLPIAMTPESVFYSHICASVIAKDHPT